jgi:hypothetical protein
MSRIQMQNFTPDTVQLFNASILGFVHKQRESTCNTLSQARIKVTKTNCKSMNNGTELTVTSDDCKVENGGGGARKQRSSQLIR